MIAAECQNASAACVAPSVAKRPAATAPRPPFIARKEQAAQSSPPKRAAAKAKSEARESGGERGLRLVFADSEAARRAAAPNAESGRDADDIREMCVAAMVVIGGLHHFRAFSRATAVPVARIASYNDYFPIASLLAAAESLRCAAFAVFRDDERGQAKLWLAGRVGVLEEAERYREAARENERVAEDLARFAALMTSGNEQRCGE